KQFLRVCPRAKAPKGTAVFVLFVVNNSGAGAQRIPLAPLIGNTTFVVVNNTFGVRHRIRRGGATILQVPHQTWSNSPRHFGGNHSNHQPTHNTGCSTQKPVPTGRFALPFANTKPSVANSIPSSSSTNPSSAAGCASMSSPNSLNADVIVRYS